MPATQRSKPEDRVTGAPRLSDFMVKHGLRTTNDLAQVFRVDQTTAARWLRLAASQPLDEVMPGPAMILFEMMERGLETPDLATMGKLSAVGAGPLTFGVIDGERGWRVETSGKYRNGARVVLPTGHFIVVHPGWFKDRIVALGRPDTGGHHDVRQELIERYQDALRALAALPR